MKLSKSVLAAVLGYGAIWLLVFAQYISRTDLIFAGDATGYHGGAIHLLLRGMYSFDGITPTITREPGMSLFLAGVYAIFGIGNAAAVFAVHGLLYLTAVLVVTREWAHRTSARIADIAAVLLLLFPPIFSVIFSLNRECLAMSLIAFTAAAWMRALRKPSLAIGALTGLLLGITMITYAAFLVFPLFFIATSLLLKLPWKVITVAIAVAVLPVVPWGVRNEMVSGRLCLTGCYRPVMQWYVRGERSEHLRGLEPLKCLAAEYVTRDWSNRSPYCSFNAVWHERWPEGFDESPTVLPVGEEAIEKIFRFFPYYLWDSMFEVIELHIPYVHFWGRTYNILAVIGTLLLYAGILLGLPDLRRNWRRWFPPLAFMIYVTGLFSLTDATPRYLMPVIFNYALLAGIGYDRILKSVCSPSRSSSRR